MLPEFPPLPPDPVSTLVGRGSAEPSTSSRPGRIPSASSASSASSSSPSGHRFQLPDATPLLLTMSRKVVYVSLVGNFGVQTPEDAIVLLYLCSPYYDPRARWTAPEPIEDGAAESPLREDDPDFYTALRSRIDDWGDTLPHTSIEELYVLACSLWNDQHVTFPIVVPGSETPETGQKKSPDSPPTGPPPTSASSPAAT